ncbi:MAG: hypothetical protein IPG21_11135 [Saprospiraceae bacterium]|nr:hypothetical protein [Candidatus Vicinibacter affinis]
MECLKNSSLRGKPLIVGGNSSRGVVAACSYEARAFGIHSAMPVKMAKDSAHTPSSFRGTWTAQQILRTGHRHHQRPRTDFRKSLYRRVLPRLTGMDRYFGCMKWSDELRQSIIRESGLPISFGLSVNKLASKVGTGEAKPNGTREIPSGTEKDFLAPLSTAKIPGIGKETYKKLSFMGVRTIKVLSEIPAKLLERQFGENGRSLWEHANAIDHRPVVPYHEAKSISKERTLNKIPLT